MFAIKRTAVVFEKVHDKPISFVHPVGSPSFMTGCQAARIGSRAKGVSPTAKAIAPTSTSFQRKNVEGFRTTIATVTAGPTSSPAG
jgi:hypothetical protein